jgi:hypothetical protein
MVTFWSYIATYIFQYYINSVTEKWMLSGLQIHQHYREAISVSVCLKGTATRGHAVILSHDRVTIDGFWVGKQIY